VKDIKKFMDENSCASLVFNNGITMIHRNPMIKSDYYVFGEDEQGNYWEFSLNDFLKIKNYSNSKKAQLYKQTCIIE
jgi:hypothetical protein